MLYTTYDGKGRTYNTFVQSFSASLYSFSFSLQAALLSLELIFRDFDCFFSSSLKELSYSMYFAAWLRGNILSSGPTDKSNRCFVWRVRCHFTFSYLLEALAYLPILNHTFPSSFFLAAASIFSVLVFRSQDSFS